MNEQARTARLTEAQITTVKHISLQELLHLAGAEAQQEQIYVDVLIENKGPDDLSIAATRDGGPGGNDINVLATGDFRLFNKIITSSFWLKRLNTVTTITVDIVAHIPNPQ
jgi:hypothetical protein